MLAISHQSPKFLYHIGNLGLEIQWQCQNFDRNLEIAASVHAQYKCGQNHR